MSNVYRAEKPLSHDAVETGREIAMTPSLYNSGNAALYRSMCEMKPTNVFGLSSLLSLSNRRLLDGVCGSSQSHQQHKFQQTGLHS